jgi:sporulation protein YqfC
MFELPGEVLAGLPKFSMTGNRHLHIEGHKGVLEYSGALIGINGGAALIKIYGAQLEIVSMNAEELLITGDIHKFEFE